MYILHVCVVSYRILECPFSDFLILYTNKKDKHIQRQSLKICGLVIFSSQI